MKLISILKGMISQIYIHINDLKPIMPFKINQDVYENHQGRWVYVASTILLKHQLMFILHIYSTREKTELVDSNFNKKS